jgi:hypothetical protein
LKEIGGTAADIEVELNEAGKESLLRLLERTIMNFQKMGKGIKPGKRGRKAKNPSSNKYPNVRCKPGKKYLFHNMIRNDDNNPPPTDSKPGPAIKINNDYIKPDLAHVTPFIPSQTSDELYDVTPFIPSQTSDIAGNAADADELYNVAQFIPFPNSDILGSDAHADYSNDFKPYNNLAASDTLLSPVDSCLDGNIPTTYSDVDMNFVNDLDPKELDDGAMDGSRNIIDKAFDTPNSNDSDKLTNMLHEINPDYP